MSASSNTNTTASAATAAAAGEEKKGEAAKNTELGLLEEDDEFEEFPAEGECGGDGEGERRRQSNCRKNCVFVDWETKDEDQDDVNVWEDNWDDDNVEDDFSVQLK